MTVRLALVCILDEIHALLVGLDEIFVEQFGRRVLPDVSTSFAGTTLVLAYHTGVDGADRVVWFLIVGKSDTQVCLCAARLQVSHHALLLEYAVVDDGPVNIVWKRTTTNGICSSTFPGETGNTFGILELLWGLLALRYTRSGFERSNLILGVSVIVRHCQELSRRQVPVL